jgi:hypothetical protein
MMVADYIEILFYKSNRYCPVISRRLIFSLIWPFLNKNNLFCIIYLTSSPCKRMVCLGWFVDPKIGVCDSICAAALVLLIAFLPSGPMWASFVRPTESKKGGSQLLKGDFE